MLSHGGKEVFTVKSDVALDGFLAALREIPPGRHVFFEGDIFGISNAANIIRERSLVLCATSRSTTMRVAIPEIARVAEGMLQLFDANHLMPGELADFHDLIDSMGFWPQMLSNLPSAVRIRKLQKDFDGNINAIILQIFENAIVREQILGQWQSALVGLRPIMDHFIVGSYMQMIDISIPTYILNEFQNMDYGVLRSLQNDIIAVSYSGKISFGNSIIGEFVLRSHPKKDDIIGAIARFANFVDGHESPKVASMDCSTASALQEF